MENTVASQEFVILALGLILSFIVVASIGFTPTKYDEKAEEDPVDKTQVPPWTDFNETLDTIQRLKKLEQQGLLKRYEPYQPKTTRRRYTSNNNSDLYYAKVDDYDDYDDDYYNDNIDYSNHYSSSHDSSHDCGSYDDGGGCD
jgi:hypothetical protein